MNKNALKCSLLISGLKLARLTFSMDSYNQSYLVNFDYKPDTVRFGLFFITVFVPILV